MLSVFDLKSLVTLTQPVPLAVWATVCAILLLGVLLRRSDLPLPISNHGGKIWAGLLLLPVILIVALFFADERGQVKVPSQRAPTPELRATQANDVPKFTTPPSHVLPPVSPDCLAAAAGKEGIDELQGPDGHPRLVARRSVNEPDPAKRFTAMTIAEERAGADLVRYAQRAVSVERTTTTAAAQPQFREVIRSLAAGTLSGVRTQMSCYVNGTAWVVLVATNP